MTDRVIVRLQSYFLIIIPSTKWVILQRLYTVNQFLRVSDTLLPQASILLSSVSTYMLTPRAYWIHLYQNICFPYPKIIRTNGTFKALFDVLQPYNLSVIIENGIFYARRLDCRQRPRQMAPISPPLHLYTFNIVIWYASAFDALLICNK